MHCKNQPECTAKNTEELVIPMITLESWFGWWNFYIFVGNVRK
jgi:hypothetical protein